MPVIPCVNKNLCPSDESPFLNLSSEAIDLPDRIGRGYAYDPTGGHTPPLDVPWVLTACDEQIFTFADPPTAAQIAAVAAIICVIHGHDPDNPPPIFYNTAQTCCGHNACGELKCFTVGPGGVAAASQAEADAHAHAVACAGMASILQADYVLVGNDEQSYTASCAADQCPRSITRVVAKDTYQASTCHGVEAAALLKNQLNAEALADATLQAINALGACVYGNDAMEATMFCPGNPGLTAHVAIEQCRYTSSNPADIPVLNQRANTDLNNQLSAALAAQGGCICSPPVTIALNESTPLVSTACALQYQIRNADTGLLVPVPNFVVINGAGFDVYAFYWGLTASCLPRRIKLVPVNYAGPDIFLSHSGVCPPCC